MYIWGNFILKFLYVKVCDNYECIINNFMTIMSLHKVREHVLAYSCILLYVKCVISLHVVMFSTCFIINRPSKSSTKGKKTDNCTDEGLIEGTPRKKRKYTKRTMRNPHLQLIPKTTSSEQDTQGDIGCTTNVTGNKDCTVKKGHKTKNKKKTVCCEVHKSTQENTGSFNNVEDGVAKDNRKVIHKEVKDVPTVEITSKRMRKCKSIATGKESKMKDVRTEKNTWKGKNKCKGKGKKKENQVKDILTEKKVRKRSTKSQVLSKSTDTKVKDVVITKKNDISQSATPTKQVLSKKRTSNHIRKSKRISQRSDEDIRKVVCDKKQSKTLSKLTQARTSIRCTQNVEEVGVSENIVHVTHESKTNDSVTTSGETNMEISTTHSQVNTTETKDSSEVCSMSTAPPRNIVSASSNAYIPQKENKGNDNNTKSMCTPFTPDKTPHTSENTEKGSVNTRKNTSKSTEKTVTRKKKVKTRAETNKAIPPPLSFPKIKLKLPPGPLTSSEKRQILQAKKEAREVKKKKKLTKN